MVKKPLVEPAYRYLSGPRRGAVTRGPRRPALRPLVAAMAATSSWCIALPAEAQLPTGPTVVSGSASVATSGSRMTVTNGAGAIVDWRSFSIGAANGVHFQQPGAASQILNRVTGNDPSQILGSLSSNGKVWLINPHGVLFGRDARIDVAGLVASTLALSNADFLAGRFGFAATGGGGPGTVTNQGEIRTTFGGRVWLLGDQVRNEGLIQAPGGGIVLAAGRSVELVDSGLPNVVVRVTAPADGAVNLGTLVADGGHVDVHGGIVNQDGIVRADRIDAGPAGSIVLKAGADVTLGQGSTTQASGGAVRIEAGGTVNHRGEIVGADVAIAADRLQQQGRIAAPGGSVAMTAATVTYLDGTVDVSDPQATGGTIRLATGKLEGMAGGSLRADGRQGGGIRVTGRGMVAFSSTLSATGRDDGGGIEVSGDSVYLLNARVDASGDARGGTVHLGGGWQGGGELPHAREVLVGVGSEVRANGEAGGKGGEVVVWSTQSSEHYGALQARGGGRIELSSQGEIRQTGTLEAGAGGIVLFDPKNLIVTDSPPDSIALARKVVSGNTGNGQPALADGDWFGGAIALSGDRLAVGATHDDTGGVDRGAVHLFTGVGTDFSKLVWQKKLASGTGAIRMPSLREGDWFGSAIALDGDRLAVGASFDRTNDSALGAVHLFTGVGSDFSGLAWQRRLLSNSGAVGMPTLGDGDNFGSAVALNGDRLAVGAVNDATGGPSRGAVHLFTGVGVDFSALAWQKSLTSGKGAAGMPPLTDVGRFGNAVSLDGDRLAIGALEDSSGGPSRGAVHLFTGVGTDFSSLVWKKSLTSGAGATSMPVLGDSSWFGGAVALDGDRLAVGSPGDSANGPRRGAVHLFTGVGTDFSGLAWQKKLASGSGAIGMPALRDTDQFGSAVALNGDQLAVGALWDDTGGTDRGALYLFTGLSTLGSGAGMGDVTFGANPSGTSYITPTTLKNLLDVGTAVSLQASNDLTVLSPVVVANASGNGGRLTLQAGRNISFLASITTDNGGLTAVAGDRGADLASRDVGTPSLTLATGVTLDVGTGTAILAAVDGSFVNNAGTSALATSGVGRWLVYAADPATSLKGLAGFAKHYDQVFVPASLPAYASSGNWFLYSLAPVLSVTPGSQTVTYGDALPAFTAAYIGFIDGDTAATAGLAGAATWNVEGPISSSGRPAAGSHDVGYTGGLASGLGYRFADNPASRNELSVTAKALVATYAGSNKIYDGTTAASVAGASADILAGDAIGFSQTASFRDRKAGTGKTVDVRDIALGGADAGNYALQNGTATTTADIAQKPITLALVGTVSKVYDGTTAATFAPGNIGLAGVVSDDAVGATATGAAYDSRNAGTGKAVSVAGASLTGADAGNYSLDRPAPSSVGTITPAPLTYVADAKTGAVGAPLPDLTGTVTGFVVSDNLTNSTSGTLEWKTPATTASSLAGTYSIDGSGLSAANYTFGQAASNATALTLVVANNPELPQKRIAASTTQAVEVAMRAAAPVLDWGGRGLNDRATIMMSPQASSFEAVNLALMTRDEMQQLIDARKEFMRKLLFNAIFKLQQDPSLADVRPCPSLADANSGLCMTTPEQHRQLGLKAEAHRNKPRVKAATLPQIERKVVVLFGINRYADKTIPPLESAVPDAEVVGRLFAEKLGYEARVVKNPTKADIFRTLNQLAAEVDVNDSVIVYYAGHGYLDEKTGAGYWVPSDGSPDDPAGWISNADISKMLSEISARQVAMISDSCYSGAFTKEEKVASSVGEVRPSEVLTKRSVVVMSSGGDEPVADTGKDGHSIFAWQLMQALRNVENWQPGNTIFERVQREVSRSFPQTPQYGAAASAGHQAGGEYLFEVRQLEEAVRN